MIPGCFARESRWSVLLPRPFIPVFFLAVILPGVGLGADKAPALPPPANGPVDFNKDIQPILLKNCYSCHGPDKQKGELRWDMKSSVLQRTGDHGPVIVPGKSAKSRVIEVVTSDDPDVVMPPRGERLTAEQVGLLRTWIDRGAVWPDAPAGQGDARRNHWAFKAPVRPAVPEVKQSRWAKNPIDDFVLARMEKERFKPSPEADRVTLIRRVTLDLTGLPPTPKEVDEFLADRRPDAYSRVVERLLASPHYGEKWGRHWLDLARYADTNGYEKDKQRSIWPYRDWVIRAFNRDLPYDQFVIEQLAGDMLPDATLDQRVATGFLRNAMLNQEGGVEPEQFRVEALVDRVDTVGKSLLGLTINCCQCHDHKFDPFSQKEYYQLYSFLNNDDEAFIEVPTPAEQKKRDEILASVRRLEDDAMASTTNLPARMAKWEKGLAEPPIEWTVLEPTEWFNFATKFEKQEDFSLLGGGDPQVSGSLHVWINTTLTNITAFRIEALTNNNLMYGGPGLGGHGGFMVREFTVEASPLSDASITNQIKFKHAVADAEAPGFPATNAVDGKPDKGGWTATVTPEGAHQSHWAAFECDKPVGFAGGTRLSFKINQTLKAHEKKGGVDAATGLDCHVIGCVRLSAYTNSGALKADPLTPEQRKWLAIPAEQRTPEQRRELFNAFRRGNPEFAELNKKIDESWGEWPYPSTSLVLHERSVPRVTHIFKRGDRLRPADVVEPAVLSVLNPLPEGAPRNRLGFAKWITDTKNPTIARALVNRVWMIYFGQGLVATPEDFGTRVETPSHPELLDWLACEFMSPTVAAPEPGQPAAVPPQAWGLKNLHRLIVHSATYRQSSRVTPENYARDQYNRWLERAPRVRVDAEGVQDIALFTSGLLNTKIGGPSVYPPIPASVGDTVYGGFSWPETKGEDRYRRGLYTFWKRSLPFPSLTAFDEPSGEISCPRRVRSNTPLQALTTLNEKTFVEASQAMALRVMKEGGGDETARAKYAFRLCTGRQPTAAELADLLKFWREQYAYFEKSTAEAVKVAVADPAKLPADVNLHQAAAWAMVSRAILNLDETITKE